MSHVYSTPLAHLNQPNMQVINNNNKYCATCAALLTDSSSVYCDAHKYMHQNPATSQQTAPDLRHPELVVADMLCYATQWGLDDNFVNNLGLYLETHGVDPASCTLAVGITIGACETRTIITFVDGKISRLPYLKVGREVRSG